MSFRDFIDATIINKRGYKYHTYETLYKRHNINTEVFKLFHYGANILTIKMEPTMEVTHATITSVSDRDAINKTLDEIYKIKQRFLGYAIYGEIATFIKPVSTAMGTFEIPIEYQKQFEKEIQKLSLNKPELQEIIYNMHNWFTYKRKITFARYISEGKIDKLIGIYNAQVSQKENFKKRRKIIKTVLNEALMTKPNIIDLNRLFDSRQTTLPFFYSYDNHLPPASLLITERGNSFILLKNKKKHLVILKAITQRIPSFIAKFRTSKTLLKYLKNCKRINEIYGITAKYNIENIISNNIKISSQFIFIKDDLNEIVCSTKKLNIQDPTIDLLRNYIINNIMEVIPR